MSKFRLLGTLTVLCAATTILATSQVANPWKALPKTVSLKSFASTPTLAPDGKVAAWASTDGKEGDDQNVLNLYDPVHGILKRLTLKLGQDDWHDIKSVVFSADSTMLAVAIQPNREVGLVNIYDGHSGKFLRKIKYTRHEDVLHDDTITSFVGDTLIINDEFYGTYYFKAWVKTGFDPHGTKEDYLFASQRVGNRIVWVSPSKIDSPFYSESKLNFGYVRNGKKKADLSFKTGSNVDSIDIMPDFTGVVTCETGKPKELVAKGLKISESVGGFIICHDMKTGKPSYLLGTYEFYIPKVAFSANAKTMLLYNAEKYRITFYVRP